MTRIARSLYFVLVLLVPLLVWGTTAVHATAISYNATNLGGTRWQYDYTISNDTLPAPITEFTLYYEYGLYDVLDATPVTDWILLTVDPTLILSLPQDGFYDATALGSGIAPGATSSVFPLSFDWLGFGQPGVQRFEIVNPDTFEVVDSGSTTSSAPVPEPGTVILFASGVVSLVSLRRMLRTKAQPGTSL